MVASLGRLDALVFTGGVGEHAPAVRAAAAAGLGFLGVRIDSRRNEDVHESDADVSAGDASVRTLVVRSREDIEIARQVRALLAR
jgi:acetate kinase